MQEQFRPKKLEKIRAWRAPKSEVDEAVGKFTELERDDTPRAEAHEQATQGLSTKQQMEYASTLAAAERFPFPRVSTERKIDRGASREREVLSQNVQAALRRFNFLAIEHGSDMREAFTDIVKEMKLKPLEQAAFAKEIMSVFTGKDARQEEEAEESGAREETNEGIPLSAKSTLIPRDEHIERLQEIDQIPDSVKARIREMSRSTRLKFSEDGVEVVGEVKKKKRNKRNKQRPQGRT